MPQQSAATGIWQKTDPPKMIAANIAHAIVFGQTLVQKRVIGLQQIKYAAVLINNTGEKQLGFAPHGLSKIVVEVRKQTHVRKR